MTNGDQVVGSYGVAGDVINEIGGSSEDKSDLLRYPLLKL